MTAPTLLAPASGGHFDAYPPPTFATPRNPDRRTLGHGTARLAAIIGWPFMGWQKYVAEVAGEVDDDGQFVYRSVDITVPRQAGKTWLYGVAMDQRALTKWGARVWFTMQAGKDAVDWLINEHWPQLEAVWRQVSLRRSAGSEHLRWDRSGGLIRPFPPQPDALHSKYSDLVVVDEAWAFDLVRGRALDQAIIPTQATRPNAQVWKISTAGDDSSTWWLGQIEKGRADVQAGRESGRCYFEWSCPDGLDPTDEASWPLYHPAYGRTIHAAAMHAALDELGTEEFARAYGNRWVHTSARVIPGAAWLAAADTAQELPSGPCAIGFDVAMDRTEAAVVMAWRDSLGVPRIEVADTKPTGGWVPDRLVGLTERWRPIGVGYEAAGPALDVADRAVRLGVEVSPLNARQYAAACAGFLSDLTSDPPGVRYRPNEALDLAAQAATRRPLGDAWVWGRRGSTVSIATLTAATCALWALDHGRQQGDFRIY